jgi:hypothetical protein
MHRKLTQQLGAVEDSSSSVPFRAHSLALGAGPAGSALAKSLRTEKQRACNCIEMVRSVPTRAGWAQ